MAVAIPQFLFGITLVALLPNLLHAQSPDAQAPDAQAPDAQAPDARSPDLVAAERELSAVFERSPGTALGDPQQQQLAAFLQRYEGEDLGALGYARGLDFYFRRDALGGAAALDRFFADHDRIGPVEHAQIAGRIYLVAMREASRRPDTDAGKLQRWAEHSAALFPDLRMVARQAVMISGSIADGVAFRQALVRGMQRSGADAATKDQFLAILYAPLHDGGVSVSGSGRDVVATSPPPLPSSPLADMGAVKGEPAGAPQHDAVAGEHVAAASPGQALTVGALLPHLPIEQALNTKPGFQLADLRGKVVVLDFFASWSSPCLASLPARRELQVSHGGAVQVLGVTTFCGRGTDFSSERKAAPAPQGGTSVVGLGRNDELALYGHLTKAFGIEYPIVFTSETAAQKAFGVTTLPTSIIVGKDGRIVGRIVGSGSDQQRQLAELVGQAQR